MRGVVKALAVLLVAIGLLASLNASEAPVPALPRELPIHFKSSIGVKSTLILLPGKGELVSDTVPLYVMPVDLMAQEDAVSVIKGFGLDPKDLQLVYGGTPTEPDEFSLIWNEVQVRIDRFWRSVTVDYPCGSTWNDSEMNPFESWPKSVIPDQECKRVIEGFVARQHLPFLSEDIDWEPGVGVLATTLAGDNGPDERPHAYVMSGTVRVSNFASFGWRNFIRVTMIPDRNIAQLRFAYPPLGKRYDIPRITHRDAFIALCDGKGTEVPINATGVAITDLYLWGSMEPWLIPYFRVKFFSGDTYAGDGFVPAVPSSWYDSVRGNDLSKEGYLASESVLMERRRGLSEQARSSLDVIVNARSAPELTDEEMVKLTDVCEVHPRLWAKMMSNANSPESFELAESFIENQIQTLFAPVAARRRAHLKPDRVDMERASLGFRGVELLETCGCPLDAEKKLEFQKTAAWSSLYR